MPVSPSAGRRPQQRGSTLIEFSLVLLPLMGLLFLTLDLAWILFSWACIQEGAREGVRTAITGQTDANIIAVVQSYSFGFAKNTKSSTQIQVVYLSSSNPDPTHPLPGTGTSCSGNIVKVVVAGVSISPLMPLWRGKAPISISAAAADLVESNSTCR